MADSWKVFASSKVYDQLILWYECEPDDSLSDGHKNTAQELPSDYDRDYSELFFTSRSKLSAFIGSYVMKCVQKTDFEKLNHDCKNCYPLNRRWTDLARFGRLFGLAISRDPNSNNDLFTALNTCYSIVSGSADLFSSGGSSFSAADMNNLTTVAAINCCLICLATFAANALEVLFANFKPMRSPLNDLVGDALTTVERFLIRDDYSLVDQLSDYRDIYEFNEELSWAYERLAERFYSMKKEEGADDVCSEEVIIVKNHFRAILEPGSGNRIGDWTFCQSIISTIVCETISKVFVDSLLLTFANCKESDHHLSETNSSTEVIDVISNPTKWHPLVLHEFTNFLDNLGSRNPQLIVSIQALIISKIHLLQQMVEESPWPKFSNQTDALPATILIRVLCRLLGYSAKFVKPANFDAQLTFFDPLVLNSERLILYSQCAIEYILAAKDKSQAEQLAIVIEQNKNELYSLNASRSSMALHTFIHHIKLLFDYFFVITKQKRRSPNQFLIFENLNQVDTPIFADYLNRFPDFMTLAFKYPARCDPASIAAAMRLDKPWQIKLENAGKQMISNLSYSSSSQLDFETLFFARQPLCVQRAIRFVSDWHCSSSIKRIQDSICKEFLMLAHSKPGDFSDERASQHLSCRISEEALMASRRAASSVRDLLSDEGLSSQSLSIAIVICQQHARSKILNWARAHGSLKALLEDSDNLEDQSNDSAGDVEKCTENEDGKRFEELTMTVSGALESMGTMIRRHIKRHVDSTEYIKVIHHAMKLMQTTSQSKRKALIKTIFDMFLIDAYYSRTGQSMLVMRTYRDWLNSLTEGEINWISFHKQRRAFIRNGTTITSVQIANIRRVKFFCHRSI